MNTYKQVSTAVGYSGCSIYGANGSLTGGACALPEEVRQFQAVTSDTIYVPSANEMISVSTGSVGWTSGDPDSVPVGAVAGSRVVFVSGTSLLAQPY